MSKAVICDDCHKVFSVHETLHGADAKLEDGHIVYSADMCKNCQLEYDMKSDVYGWHFIHKKFKGGQ